MSNRAEFASGAGASCLAGELSRLRRLAPFPPLSPALKGPMMALFCFPNCHRYGPHHVSTQGRGLVKTSAGLIIMSFKERKMFPVCSGQVQQPRTALNELNQLDCCYESHLCFSYFSSKCQL